MWLYFNSNGQLVTSLEHGTIARVGSTKFSIFAVFEDIDSEETLENYSATIKLRKPDLTGSSYPTLLMTGAYSTFAYVGDEDEDSVEPFEVGTTYYGFLFDFGDFNDNDDEEVLLDTDGLWEATITIVGTDLNVQGVATFNVSGTGSEDETTITYDFVTNQLTQYINARALKTQVIITIDSSEEDVSSYDDGQLFYGIEEHKIYQLTDGELEEVSTDFEVDDALSSTSENPVQNQVIYAALETKQNALTFDTEPISGSTNPIESGGLYDYLGSNYFSQTETEDVIADAIAGVYKYIGSLTVDEINELDTSTLENGYVYNITDDGTLTEGSVVVSAGDNVAWTGTEWDLLASYINVSNLVDLTSEQTITGEKTLTGGAIVTSGSTSFEIGIDYTGEELVSAPSGSMILSSRDYDQSLISLDSVGKLRLNWVSYVLPATTETYNLGSSSLVWNYTYTKYISDGTNSISVADIVSIAETGLGSDISITISGATTITTLTSGKFYHFRFKYGSSAVVDFGTIYLDTSLENSYAHLTSSLAILWVYNASSYTVMLDLRCTGTNTWVATICVPDSVGGTLSSFSYDTLSGTLIANLVGQ